MDSIIIYNTDDGAASVKLYAKIHKGGTINEQN